MPPTFTLSGFADEIDPDLETQLETLTSLGVSHVDLRSVEGTNVLEFSAEQVASIRETLEDYGVSVAAIGSPVGKVDVSTPFAEHREDVATAIEMAEAFDADYVRVFSYWMPEDEDPRNYRETVIERMAKKAEMAAAADVVLVHENEKDIYGDTPARCRDLLTAVDSPHLRAAFDPANFLEVGVRPFPDALLDLVELVEYLHVKDAVFGERGEIRVPGEGDGEIAAVVDALDRRGFEGFAAMEPHLADAEAYGGFSGPEAFETATEAFVDVLEEEGITYA